MTNKASQKKIRSFSYLIGIGMPLIIGWLIPFLAGHSFRAWTLLIGIPTLILGLLFPRSLEKPYQAWMQLGDNLGYLNSHIILGFVFVTVLLPIAFIMKAFGYDPLLSKKKNLSSYKEKRKHTRVDLTRIF